MQEFDIINNYFKKLTNTKESLNLQDDTALILPSKYKSVVNLDTIVEGEHFFNLDNPKSIATKLLQTNLSDIAAMGAKPKYWLLSISLPKKSSVINSEWLKIFVNTLQQIQKKYSFYLIGGDTTAISNKLVLSATMIGYLNTTDKPLLKKNAKEGDIICVGDMIGSSFIGFNLLNNKLHNFNNGFKVSSKTDYQYFVNQYLYPKAQVELGAILVKYANSCADISDGLIADLEKICIFSNKKANIYLDNIPFNKKAYKFLNTLDLKLQALSWGDDYKLIFTIPNAKFLKLKKELIKHNINIYKIGYISKVNKENNFLELLDKNNSVIPISTKGFKHSF